MDQCASADMVLCDTMNFWIESTPDALDALLARVDCLVINDSKPGSWANEPNLIVAARKIRDRGPRILIIKKENTGR